MARRTAQSQMEDFFYRELLKYLKLAEEKRRWNVFRDIPWDAANPETSDQLAHCVETFCAVEMYLPDFTSKLLQMIRRSRGRAWFHANWGYEESKHSLALETWLVASGHRTEKQREEYQNAILGAEWELPFDHPRQMVIYTMIQELATFWNYRNLEKTAAREKDLALVSALRVISVDERVHYNFFRNVVKQWMRLDDRGTVEDIKYVFEHFTMPGDNQIPNYKESARILAKSGIYGPREYVKLVKNPILEDIGLDKGFNRLEENEARDRANEEERINALKREQITLGNGHAVPVNNSPYNGRPRSFNSNALNEVLANGRPENDREEIPQEDEERKSPFLELIGLEAKKRTPSSSVIMGWQAEEEKLRGSRGMDKLDALDQKLIERGDELSNNAEEMRAERAKIRRNRVKNTKLFKNAEEE